MKPNLIDTILLALMVAVLMIGAHQIYTIAQTEGLKMGFLKSYWIFMILMILTVIYQARKNKMEKEEGGTINKSEQGKKPNKGGKSKRK